METLITWLSLIEERPDTAVATFKVESRLGPH